MIHVIIGQTGEYSDYGEWVVTAYENAPEAERHLRALRKWCKAHGYDKRGGVRPGVDCPLDPRFSCDYTGTTYEREAIPSGSRYRTLVSKVLSSNDDDIRSLGGRT